MCVYAESTPHPTAVQANKFASSLVVLSDHLIKQHAVFSEKSLGGYGGMTNDLAFYTEIKTVHQDDLRPISTVRWETKSPKNLHSVDVYIYDQQNRLIRDYSASYLPASRRAPYQTLINLHRYNAKLHSVRQFNALGDILYEECRGHVHLQDVNFVFDYSEIPDSSQDFEDPGLRQAYLACFDASQSSAEPFTDPLVEVGAIKW